MVYTTISPGSVGLRRGCILIRNRDRVESHRVEHSRFNDHVFEVANTWINSPQVTSQPTTLLHLNHAADLMTSNHITSKHKFHHNHGTAEGLFTPKIGLGIALVGRLARIL